MTSWRFILALLAIFTAGLAVRLIGLDYLLPHTKEADANIVYQSHVQLGGPAKSKYHSQAQLGSPARGKYPMLLVAANSMLQGSGRGELSRGSSLEAHLENASAAFANTRLLIALLSFLIVPATLLIARRLLSPPWSLLATGLVATCPLLVSYSTQARPHAAVAGLSAVAVVAALWLARRATPLAFVVTGLCTGLAVAAFQSGVFVLGPFAVAAFLAVRTRGTKTLPWLALSLVTIMALGSWSYASAETDAQPGVTDGVPESVDPSGALQSSPRAQAGGEPKAASPDQLESAKPANGEPSDAPETGSDRAGSLKLGKKVRDKPLLGRHRIFYDLFNGRGFADLFIGLRSYNPSLLVLASFGALCGLLSLIRRESAQLDSRKRADLLIVGAFLIPSLFVFGMYEGSGQRYFLPVLPYLSIVGAHGMSLIARTLLRGKTGAASRRAIMTAAALIAIGLPLATSIRIVMLRCRPDTLTLAARWIETHVPQEGSRVFVGSIEALPLRQASDELLRSRYMLLAPWARYQVVMPPQSFNSYAYELRYLDWNEIRDLVTHRRLQARMETYLSEFAPDYAVIAPFGVAVEYDSVPPLPLATRRAIVKEGGEIVHVIAPRAEDNAMEPGLTHFLGPNAVIDLWRVRAFGPTVEIYAW